MAYDLSKLSDEELDALIAETAPSPSPAPQFQAPNKPLSEYTDAELDALIAATAPDPATPNEPTMKGTPTTDAPPPPNGGISLPQYSPNEVGRAQTLVTAEEAKAMPSISGTELSALKTQEAGGPMAYEADGSFGNWLGNLWNTISYNSTGKLTARSTARHNQDILRGTVKKDGKDVPLTQLDDDELDYLVDSAGWNGWTGWLGSFVGNRSDDGIMQEWDRTTGAKIADPVVRKAARVKYAQDIARMNVEQQESEKLAARTEIENREKDFGAGAVSGFWTNASYMLPYLLPHTHGIVAGLVEGGDRAQELMADAYYVDDDGVIRVAAERDSTGAALAKGAARGAIAPLIEKIGGELGAGAIGAVVKNTLGRVPLFKAVGDKIVETSAGKAVSKWMNSMSRLGKYTGMQSMPVETLEEFEDQVIDAGLGIGLRESEKGDSTILSRAGEAAKDFFKPENLVDLAESMLILQVLGGGAAYANDRRINRNLDNLIAKEAGVPPEELANYTLEEKHAAWQAFVDGLSDEEIAKRFNKGAEAINKLVNTFANGRTDLVKFTKDALASVGEGSVSPAPVEAPAPRRYTEADILTAEEVTPKKETTNETGTDETQSQPEQAVGVPPSEGEAARPVEEAETGGEAQSAIEAPTIAPVETAATTPPTSAEAVESGSGASDEGRWGSLPKTERPRPFDLRTAQEALGKRLEAAGKRLEAAPGTQRAELEEELAKKKAMLDSGNISKRLNKRRTLRAEVQVMEEYLAALGEQQEISAPNKPVAGTVTPPTTALPVTPITTIDNNKQTDYNVPQTIVVQEGTGNEGQQTQESIEGTGDEFSRLQARSRAISDEERRAYRSGSKRLGKQELGVPDGGWSENRRGTVVGALRGRVQSANSGRGILEFVTLSTKSKQDSPSESFKLGRVDGSTFRDVLEVTRNYLHNGELVDLHDTYGDDVKCYLSEDGLCGFAVEADGNLVSVFSLRKGSLSAMANAMKEAGATHLDAYASKNQDLSKIYARVLGFKTASRMGYNMDYDHDDIAANHGNPDVVFMVLPKEGQMVEERRFDKDSYDAAVSYQKAALAVPPTTNKLKTADGVDPLAVVEDAPVTGKKKRGGQKKSDQKKLEDFIKKRILKAKNIYDRVMSNNPEAPLSPMPFRKGKNNVLGFDLAELKKIVKHDNIAKEYLLESGMSEEQANELLEILEIAKIEQYLSASRKKQEDFDNEKSDSEEDSQVDSEEYSSEDSAEGKGKVTYEVGAMRALRNLRTNPDDLDALAKAFGRVSAASEAAGRHKKDRIKRLWDTYLKDLVAKINTLSPVEQNNLAGILRAQGSGLDRADTQNQVSRDAGTFEGRGDSVDTDVEEKVNILGENVEETEADVAGRKEAMDSQETESGPAANRQGGARASSDRGSIQLETKDGKVNVVWRNELGDVSRRAPIEALRVAAEKSPELKELITKLESGEDIRFSRSTSSETQEERDLRFALDEDYQKWLGKANDSESMRERFERRQIRIAERLMSNYLGGMGKVRILDREFIESEDGDDTRYLRNPETGRVVGTWNRKTNDITLFRGANATTLIHELGGHAAYQYAQEQAAQGNDALLRKMDEVIDYALTNPVFKDFVADIRSRYPDASREVLRDEIWAALREHNSPAMEAAIKTLQGKAWYNRAWQAIKEAFKAILTKMGFNKTDLRGIDKMKPEEFLSFLDREMADGRRLGELMGVDLDDDGGSSVRKMFVGEIGMQAFGQSADKAREMEASGQATRREIWQQTGWWRGKDGLWRFEILDPKPIQLSQENISNLRNLVKKNGFAQMSLANMKGVDELLAMHPDIGDLKIVILPRNDKQIKGLSGFYDPDTGNIAVADSQLDNLDEFNATIIHEIQHAIQAKEGFSRGGNANTGRRIAMDQVRRSLEDVKAQIAELDKKDNPSVVDKANLGMLQRSEKYYSKILDGKNKKGAKDLAEYFYLALTGESEARLAEARRKMTPEERLAIPPWEMFDIDEDRQVVVGDDEGGVSASMLSGPDANEVRYAASGTTTADRFMDDVQTRKEVLEEKLVDSLAPVKAAQKKIDEHARARGDEGVKEVTNADGSTDWRNSTDFVAAKDKENGHLERRLRDLKTRFIDPAMETLARAVLPQQSNEGLVSDFNLYLQCKHAAARNRKIANDRGEAYTPDYAEGMGKIDLAKAGLPALSGKGVVGLSENIANDILAEMEAKYGSGKLQNFEDAAQIVYNMLDADLDNRVESGLMSVADWASYKARRTGPMEWGTYVPLKDDLQKTEPEAYNTFKTRLTRNEFMKAKGRGSNDIAESPFAAAILQAEQGIRRSSRNVLANVEANLATKFNGGYVKGGSPDYSKTERVDNADANSQPVYAEIVPGVDVRRTGMDYTFTFADGDSVSASGGASLVANRPDVHLFKRDGKLYAIRYVAGSNGRGMTVARAFSGENMGSWGRGMEWLPKVTHWLSAMRTQYSPEFTVSNMLSDNLEAVQALVGRYGVWDGFKAFGKAVAYQVRNAKDLGHYLRTGEARGKVKEAVDAGLLTKGGVASQGIDAETAEIRNDIGKFIRKQKSWRDMSVADWAKSLGHNVVDFISIANEFAEYSTRIGLVSALEEYGVPRNEAVTFARDATVNFNRKGTAMPYINGLYMFANAAVQGSMRSVRAFMDDFSDAPKPASGKLGSNRKHKGELVSMLVAVGVAKAVIDHFLGDDDEREREGGRNAANQTEYDRKHNVGVPIGGGRQIVPLRFRGPYAAVPYLAQTFTRMGLGDITPADAAQIVISELGDQTTELIGGNGIINDKGEFDSSLVMQSMAPTLMDPFVQMATGKDYKGDNRLRMSFDKTKPMSSNAKRNTPWPYKTIAEVLNRISGGNENRIGKFDFAPENIQLFAEFLGGAPLRDINNVASTAVNLGQIARGGTPEKTLSQMPFVRRFVREYPEVTGRYYDVVEMYERDKAEFKKETRLEVRRDLRKDKPYLSAGKTKLDEMIQMVKDLTHLENGEVKRGQKWVTPKIERSEEQKEKFRKRRMRLQAKVLERLGE